MKAHLGWLATLLVACGGAPAATDTPTPPPPIPTTQVAPTAPPDPWAIDGELKREQLPGAAPSFAVEPTTLPKAPKGLPPAPASCRAFAAGGPPGKCDDPGTALASLDAALTETDADKRNRALRGLESCRHLPTGMVLALRTELAPVECADTIAGAAIASPPVGIDGVTYDALVGLGLAGMLRRASSNPPTLAAPHPKDKVKRFIDEKVHPWILGQAKAIQALSDAGSKLKYYGQAVVAVEAGMADMRFVEIVRSLPIPDEFKEDDELRNVYLNALEDVFEPRKRRGRDAALVGLGRLATIGVIRDERVDRARDLLSTMYGGSPIDALDELLMPPLDPIAPEGPEARLASRLPTFYAGILFPAEKARDASLLRMLVNKGLSLPHRIALANDPPAEAKPLLARARFELGQNYWRAVDFDEALAVLGSPKGLAPADRLLFALALGVQGGPQNAAEMMEKAPIKQLGIGDVAALDALAAEGGDLAGHAAFDAALIAELAAPKGADEAYWRAVAERYRKAAGIIVDLPTKKDASKRASEADEVADAIAEAAK